MRRTRAVALLCVLAVASLPALAQDDSKRKKKKKGKPEPEEITQTLELPKDPPAVAIGETRRLVFHVSPLSAKGLLSQQTRDGLKALQRMWSGAQPVRLRAMVAGSGDLRRVRDIVAETFTEKRQPLPALTVIRVGGLPLEGAQVVLESISVARKETLPNGLVILSGQQASSPQPLDPVWPLAEKSIADLGRAVAGAGTNAANVLRVTCFLSSLDGVDKVRALAAAQFPKAAWNVVQTQRAPERAVAECEAMAAAGAPVNAPVEFVNPEGLPASPNYAQVARLGAPRLAFTGQQAAFGFEEKDARLAFERLEKDLSEAGSSLKQAVFTSVYPLSGSIAELVRKVRFEFLDKGRPPASTLLPFDGLPSMDASFALDVVALTAK